jgi:hypothetical protein
MCTVVHQTGQDCLILRKMLMVLLIVMQLSEMTEELCLDVYKIIICATSKFYI